MSPKDAGAGARTLYLLRHAKSDWSDAGVADHDRPLADRGRKAARRMGEFVAGVRPLPSIVICSSAERARETWNEISPALGRQIEVRVEEALYGASSVDLLARARKLPDRVGAALLIGHNPGMQDLAIDLAGDGDPVGMTELTMKFPTCALATLTFGSGWPDIGPGAGYLKSLVTPRQLAG